MAAKADLTFSGHPQELRSVARQDDRESGCDEMRFPAMVQVHRMICPVQDKQVRIDLPADFPDASQVEVIVLPLSPVEDNGSDRATLEWLRAAWACVPDFPERVADLPPEPVQVP